MNKVVPYVAAAVVGIGVAVYLLAGSGSGEKPAGALDPKAVESAARSGGGADDPSGQGGDGVARKKERDFDPKNPPPAGTLRPMNQAEIAQKERHDRPYNKHFDRVSGFWRAMSMDLSRNRGNPELARACAQMNQALLDRSKQPSAELNAAAAVDSELALVEQLDAVYGKDPEYGPMLEYIRRTGDAVKRNVDPTTIPRPSSTNTNPF